MTFSLADAASHGYDRTKIHRLILDRVQVSLSQYFPDTEYAAISDSAQILAAQDAFVRRMCYTLIAEMPALLSERIVVDERWPTNWWEAVKERWFPDWALERWPVKYRVLKIDRKVYAAVCPHGAVDTTNIRERQIHLDWMASARTTR